MLTGVTRLLRCAAKTSAADAAENSQFFRKRYKVPEAVRGIRRVQLIIKWSTYSVTAACFFFYGVGGLYIWYWYGDGFLERLEDQNRSKRTSFWQRRNDAVSYQTQARTELYKFLGLNTYTVTDAGDD